MAVLVLVNGFFVAAEFALVILAACPAALPPSPSSRCSRSPRS